MSDQLINNIVDRQAVGSDKDFVDKVLDDIFSKFKEVSDLKITLGTDSSFSKATDTITKVKKVQDDLSLSVKEYNKVLDSTAQTQAKLSAASSQAAADNATAKNQLTAYNAELKANASYQNAANGSIDQARAFVKALTIERNALDLTTESGKAKQLELNATIDQQNQFIKENVDILERQKINIGNYTGALQVLKPALQQAVSALETLKIQGQENTEQYALLQKEVNLLTVVLDKNEAGFKSVNAELRANQQALEAMKLAGLEGTEAFNQLRQSVNKAQDEFNSFREAQKQLAHSPFEASLQSSIEALQGLAGIYGATVAAQQLFGKENDDLAKSMAKLQAVLVLLTSLQQVSAAVGKAEAIVDGIQTAGRAALTAVTYLYTFVTSAATVATQIFRAALAATGIGGAILLLASFVNELYKTANSLQVATDKQIAYTNAVKDFYDTLKETSEASARYDDLEKQRLQDQLDLLTAQGAEFRKIQAVKAAIATTDAKNSAEGLKNLGLANSSLENQDDIVADARTTVESLTDQYDRLGDELLAYEDIRKKAADAALKNGDNPDDDRAVKTADAHIKSLKASRDALNSQIQPGKVLIDTYDKATSSVKTLTAETIKYNNEQKAANVFNEASTRLTAIIDVNEKIVADDRKTEAARLSAINSGAAARRAIELANLTKENAAPGLSDEQKQINARNTAAAITKINAAADQEYVLLSRKYDEEAYQFKLSILKQESNDQIEKDQVVLDNEKATVDQQLAANTDLYNQKRAQATADLFNTLHDKTTTDEQRKAAEAKFNGDVLQLDHEFTTNRRKIFADGAEKLLQDGINANNKIVLNFKQQYNAAIKDLQDQRKGGKLTDSQYDRQSQALGDDLALREAHGAVANSFLKVQSTKEGTKERLDAETDLADKVKALQDQDLKNFQDHEKAKQQAAQETVDTISDVYEKTFAVIGDFLDAANTAEKNKLQSQINDVKTKSDAEVDAENKSLDTATDKAAKIATIEASAQAQSEALQRKQKQLDIQKAQFDKIKGIGEIILNTAKAVTADLLNPAKIPFDIAIGAAELAIAIAAPVPTYAAGTNYHPGGPMIVGDGGRSELMQLPDGSMFVTPRVDTYLPDMPEGTIVYPDAIKFLHNMPENILSSPGGRQANATDIALINGLKRIEQVIVDKHELHINPNFNSIMAIHKYGNSFLQYVAENVQFKL